MPYESRRPSEVIERFARHALQGLLDALRIETIMVIGGRLRLARLQGLLDALRIETLRSTSCPPGHEVLQGLLDALRIETIMFIGGRLRLARLQGLLDALRIETGKQLQGCKGCSMPYESRRVGKGCCRLHVSELQGLLGALRIETFARFGVAVQVAPLQGLLDALRIETQAACVALQGLLDALRIETQNRSGLLAGVQAVARAARCPTNRDEVRGRVAPPWHPCCKGCSMPYESRRARLGQPRICQAARCKGCSMPYESRREDGAEVWIVCPKLQGLLDALRIETTDMRKGTGATGKLQGLLDALRIETHAL